MFKFAGIGISVFGLLLLVVVVTVILGVAMVLVSGDTSITE